MISISFYKKTVYICLYSTNYGFTPKYCVFWAKLVENALHGIALINFISAARRIVQLLQLKGPEVEFDAVIQHLNGTKICCPMANPNYCIKDSNLYNTVFKIRRSKRTALSLYLNIFQKCFDRGTLLSKEEQNKNTPRRNPKTWKRRKQLQLMKSWCFM